jgi:hypothetical protein
MSLRGRAIGIITGTLLIGVAIGALLVGPMIARHHFRRAEAWRTPRGFATRLEDVIKPNPDQVDALRTILARYGDDLDEVMSRHRAEIRDMVDSLNADLDTLLTPEQKERLEAMRHHGPPEGGREPRDRHGPPKRR